MPIDAMEAVSRTTPVTHLHFSHAEIATLALYYFLPASITLPHFSYSGMSEDNYHFPNFLLVNLSTLGVPVAERRRVVARVADVAHAQLLADVAAGKGQTVVDIAVDGWVAAEAVLCDL